MASRILLITPQLYGIEKTLKSVLEEAGYEVTWLENRIFQFDYHGTRSKLKLFRKIYFFFFSPVFRYWKREIEKISDQKFDILFSINAHVICPYLLRILKSKNPDLFSVLYLWDSFSMYDWSRELKLFNKVYTFDPEDSVKYNINYKPNFFIGCSNNNDPRFHNDLLFTGKFSSDRFLMLEKLLKQLDGSEVRYYIKLLPSYKIFPHSHLFYKLLKLINIRSTWADNYILSFEALEKITTRKYFLDHRIDYSDMNCFFSGANVILDLPYQNQTGYTHRVIEALASGKKIITTNERIKKECFYNPDQINIIDSRNPEINVEWIKGKATFPVDIYFTGLELSAWIKSMINVEFV
jgi:hypothetical protein